MHLDGKTHYFLNFWEIEIIVLIGQRFHMLVGKFFLDNRAIKIAPVCPMQVLRVCIIAEIPHQHIILKDAHHLLGICRFCQSHPIQTVMPALVILEECPYTFRV